MEEVPNRANDIRRQAGLEYIDEQGRKVMPIDTSWMFPNARTEGMDTVTITPGRVKRHRRPKPPKGY